MIHMIYIYINMYIYIYMHTYVCSCDEARKRCYKLCGCDMDRHIYIHTSRVVVVLRGCDIYTYIYTYIHAVFVA